MDHSAADMARWLRSGVTPSPVAALTHILAPMSLAKRLLNSVRTTPLEGESRRDNLARRGPQTAFGLRTLHAEVVELHDRVSALEAEVSALRNERG